MRHLVRMLLICVVATAAVALAQGKPATTPPTQDKSNAAAQENPLSAYNKHVYAGVKDIILRSAEKMPEENYKFKPTEVVRSYGQILGHVADAQYLFCSKVIGEQNPAPKIEETKTSKAELITALKAAFAYCDKVYDGMTDASAVQMVKLFGSDAPKMGVLNVNTMHTVEHYGNLVTYMRMKNIVPPTSEQASQPAPKKQPGSESELKKESVPKK